MADATAASRRKLSIKPHTIVLAATWTVIVIGCVFWAYHQERQKIHNLISVKARSSFHKDVVYRSWNASHGGVYVPVTEGTEPNPLLSHIKERDLVTPSGRLLTLINPAYMTRQVHELGYELYGIRSHITSLNPIRAENAPDEWEVKALKSFEEGAKEAVSVELVDGEPQLRLMRPLMTTENCLKCHAMQGYKTGDVRGGISITTPLEPFYAAANEHRATDILGFGILWAAGIASILFANMKLRRRVDDRLAMAEALREKKLMLDNILRSARETGIVTMDPQRRITYFNPKAEELFGRGASEVVGVDILDARLHEGVTRERLEKAIGEIGSEDRFCCTLTSKGEDETQYIEVRLEGIVDREGESAGYSLFCRDVTESRRAERALRESEERYRAVAEDMPVLICRFLEGGEITYVNEAWLRYYGKEESEAIGQSITSFIVEEDRERVESEIASITASSSTRIHEHRTTARDGVMRWQRWTTHGLFDEEGVVDAYQCLVEDITAFKHRENTAAAQLRLSEFGYSRSVDELLSAFLDEAEALTGSNVGFYHFVEADQKTLLLQAWSTNTLEKMCKAEGKGSHYSIDQAGVWVDCVREGRPVVHNDYESLPHKRGLPEGHAPVIRELVAPVYRGDRIVAILGVGNKGTDYTDDDAKIISDLANTAWDIVGRKRAEEALRKSEEQVRLLLNSTAEAIYSLDLEGRCTLCNPACVEMLGYESAGELLQQDMHTLIHHTRVDGTKCGKSDCHIYKAFRSGAEVHVDDEVLWRKDGSSFPAEYWAYPMRHDGEVIGAVVTFIDITERHEAERERSELEAQLRQSQKLEAVGQLAGGVAHDFNNILTAIFGNTEEAAAQLKSEFPGAVRAIEGLNQVFDNARRASALTRQLLTFSRQDVAQPRELDLNAILSDLDKMLRCWITENISLSFKLPPELKAIWADIGQIEQVVVNLVLNATQAMPDGGQLVLETQNVTLDDAYTSRHMELRPGRYVLLAVSDTGCGMDEATRERIFEPFFTTKSVDKGTGLGLATVHGIVKQSRGYINVYSEPGRGTTFRIYFPAIEATARKIGDAAQPAASLGGTETILLCEDDEAVRELTAKSLKKAGYEVYTAGGSEEALEAARGHEGAIRLLITDVILPDQNGRVLAERLTKVIPGLSTLFISGYTADIIAHHGVLSEGVEFLEKPFTRRRLLSKVRGILDKTQASV